MKTTLMGAPLRRVEVDRSKVRDGVWPYTIPAVRDLIEQGFEPAPGLTIFIGENGSGKSTLVEAIASAWARHVRADRRNVSLKASAQPSGEDSDLYRALRLLGTPRGGKGGFFLRADLRRGSAAGIPAAGDNQVLPVFWSDNDITLMPGESQTLHASYRRANLQGASPVVTIGGWNLATVNVRG